MSRGPKHGGVHKRARAVLLRATLRAGPPYLCTYCRQPLPANTSHWDLCHDDDGVSYRVPPFGHQRCNRGSHDRWGGGDHPWSRVGRARRSRSRSDRTGDRIESDSRERLIEREAARQRRVRRLPLWPSDMRFSPFGRGSCRTPLGLSLCGNGSQWAAGS